MRELEALRSDVSNAANKVVQPKPGSAPRPKYIPPLEDFSKPPIPRPSSGPPRNVGGSSARASPAPVPTQPSLVATQARSSDPLGSSSVLPSSGVPTPQAAPTPRPAAKLPQALPPTRTGSLQSPGAGPSSPVPQRPASAAPPLSDGPPLGGRFVDGTKSMFIKPSPSMSSASPSSSSPSKKATFQSPLHASGSGSGAAPHPLAADRLGPLADPLAAVSRVANGTVKSNGKIEEELDPLGMARPSYMSASVRVQPTRPRLDAREAASKLANMF